METSLTISIDLDKTWTADPTVFALIAYTLKARGHRVVICTRRSELPHDERIRLQIPEWVDIFFANYGYKLDAVPFPVDIWIDDEPATIEPPRLLQDDL
jgi:hypothetical protein